MNERLEEDKELSVLLVSKIMEWSDLLKLSFLHDNFIVKAYDNFNLKEENGNFDLIVCKSDKEFSIDKMEILKRTAIKISSANNKRVTVGYMFGKDGFFDIFSYKGSEMSINDGPLFDNDILYLCERTLLYHDSFETAKCLKKVL